ncbi:hypothetical protein Pla110_26050 [Polystyrenella longa]|uniref:DUF2203 domain-containing protein n=1 Tax=Polystyrenella longa TaxID=2528007 RepID=A0A518CNS3_9PLAN|nr:DUF2203 domain-containing protein [Polystyrenella longa]QDU80869.1 hypothetical protein Pla110_26050 [Polystyrenella longa]
MNTAADRKFFGVDDANRMLPLVSAIVSDIVELYNDVHERRNRLARVRHNSNKTTRAEDNPYEEEVLHIEKELEADIDRLDGFVEELQKLGVELKDPVKGLVDFPTYHEGREACLCWMLGETEVGFWHDSDAGFSGRQPIEDSSITEL